MQLAVFAGVVTVAAMSPGPDFAITVRNAAVSGRRTGVMTALGIAVGVMVWSVCAALGIAALLAASATAFTVVKLVGAAYLLYMGTRAVWGALRRLLSRPAVRRRLDAITGTVLVALGLRLVVEH